MILDDHHDSIEDLCFMNRTKNETPTKSNTKNNNNNTPNNNNKNNTDKDRTEETVTNETPNTFSTQKETIHLACTLGAKQAPAKILKQGLKTMPTKKPMTKTKTMMKALPVQTSTAKMEHC